jgi:thiol-disulfide isomerase/thioredoxin
MTMEPMARHSFTWLWITWLMLAVSPSASAQQPPRNFVLHQAPKPIGALAFEDDQGRPQRIADFKGKVVLLNIWATWCGPCRQEMPALDHLESVLVGPDFEVVALSIDRKGVEAVRKFYADVGVRNLAIHLDHAGSSMRELATVGVPTTLLIDRDGRELGRIAGPADWDSASVVEFIKTVISGQPAIASDARAEEVEDAKQSGRSQGVLNRASSWLKSLLGR